MGRGQKKQPQVQPEQQNDAEVSKENNGKSYVHYCAFVLSNC